MKTVLTIVVIILGISVGAFLLVHHRINQLTPQPLVAETPVQAWAVEPEGLGATGIEVDTAPKKSVKHATPKSNNASHKTIYYGGYGISNVAIKLNILPVLNSEDKRWLVLFCDFDTHECFDGVSFMWQLDKEKK